MKSSCWVPNFICFSHCAEIGWEFLRISRTIIQRTPWMKLMKLKYWITVFLDLITYEIKISKSVFLNQMLSFDPQTALNNVSSPWCPMGTSNSMHVKLYSLFPTTKTCVFFSFFFLTTFCLVSTSYTQKIIIRSQGLTLASPFYLLHPNLKWLLKKKKSSPLHIKFPLFKISFIFQ